MRTTRITTRLAAAAVAVGSTTLLLVGALPAPAGAAAAPPYKTATTVSASPGSPYTGQSVVLTAKVTSLSHGVPSAGTFTFSATGADASVVNCDGGDVVAAVGGTATCTISGGLAAGSGPYTISAAYNDTADSTFQPSTGTKSVVVKAGKTTTVVTSSVNPSVTGQHLSFTAAVAAVSPAVGSPSGTVTFSGVTCDGGTNVIALSGGLAQCAISGGLSAGAASSVTVTGTYSGASGFLASSGSVKQTVAPAAATVTLSASPNNCVGDICSTGQGAAVSFTGTAASTGTDGGTGVPTGNLVFSIVKAGSKTGVTCDGGTNTIPLVAGQATCILAAGLPASVYFTVTATLASPGYSASAATLYENTQLAGTSTTIDTNHGVGAGETFTINAHVATAGYSGAAVPTGFVNVLVCGNNSNGSNGCQGGAAPVDATGLAQFQVGGGEFPGYYTVTAIYTGDANFYSSTAHNRLLFVAKSPTTLTLTQGGGFVTGSGNAATITATLVTPNGAAGSTLIGPPTGNIVFTITDPGGAAVNCAAGNSVPLGTGPGQTEATATCFLPPGTLTAVAPNNSLYTVHASYAGDSDFGLSNTMVTETVVPAAA